MSLHARSVEAYKLLQGGLQESSQRVTESEKRLLDHWGIDSRDEQLSKHLFLAKVE